MVLLRCAAAGGHCDAMRVILSHGVEVNDGLARELELPLTLAARSGHHRAVAFLLERGARIDAREGQRTTALMATAVRGHCDVIRVLLNHGADFAACDKWDRTAEVHARNASRSEAEALLADVRRAGSYAKYVRYPRFRLLMFRLLAEQGRAETKDGLLVRLFPAGPPASEGVKQPREAYQAQDAGIFWHIFSYWRSDRDPPPV